MAQNQIPNPFIPFFGHVFDKGQLNGNVWISDNGIVRFRKSYGFSDFEKKVINTENSVFPIASISKTFTAIAVLQLKDKKLLNLDDLVSKYLTGFIYDNITIRQLLSHTSGIRDIEIFGPLINKSGNRIFTNTDILEVLSTYKPSLIFEPGTNWKYSNIGYDLLALVVEKVAGCDFKEYLNKNIFKVAGMKHTCFKNNIVKCDLENQVQNYRYAFNFSSHPTRVDSLQDSRVKIFLAAFGGFYGDGGISSTTSDLAAFDEALYKESILSSASLEEAYTPMKLKNGQYVSFKKGNANEVSYGLGWFILQDVRNGKIVWHDGTDPGCESIFLRNISKKQLIIILDNQQDETTSAAGFVALQILNNNKVAPLKYSLTRLFARAAMENNFRTALEFFHANRADTMNFHYSEDDINNAGYEFLNNGHTLQALETFKLNVDLFPGSSNTHDSYGEALALFGRKKEAIKEYKKALELDPTKITSIEALKKLEQID